MLAGYWVLFWMERPSSPAMKIESSFLRTMSLASLSVMVISRRCRSRVVSNGRLGLKSAPPPGRKWVQPSENWVGAVCS